MVTSYPVGGPWFVVSADLDEDGHSDLAVANEWSHAVSILIGNGQGGFETPVEFPLGQVYPRWIAVGDFK